MRFETREMIDEALIDYERDIVVALTNHAYSEHVEADAQATRQANLDEQFGPDGGPPPFDPMRWNVIDQAAQGYIAEYRERLVNRGTTLISHHGIVEEIPWMRDFSNEARMRVTQIVEEGIVSGLAPKMETARALREVFDGNKAKAAMVARTETAEIRATAKEGRWKERNYQIVRITDGRAPGHFACNCEQYDGQYWTVEYYHTHHLEHPNCGRAASPVQTASIPPGTVIYGMQGATIPRVGV